MKTERKITTESIGRVRFILTSSASERLRLLGFDDLGRLSRKTKGIEYAVVRAQVHASVGDRQAREVVPRLNLIAARPQFFSVACVERINRGVRALSGANRRVELQAEIRKRLLGFLAASVPEHDTVGDDHRLPTLHFARHPHRHDLQLAIALLELERGDAAVDDGAI